MLKIIVIFIGLLHCLTGFSQSTGKTLPPRHYFFTHYTTASGLVSFQVNTTVQDQDGYIWIGTNDGLQRFDGNRYKTFRYNENNPYTIPSNLIWQLLIDKDKNLWILTSDGKAGIFNTKTFEFLPVTIKLAHEAFYLSSAPAKKLIADEFGNLFLLVPGSELVTYNKATKTFAPENNLPGLQQPSKIRAFVQEPGSHKYWMAIDELGLALFNGDSRQLSYAGNNAANEKLIEQLRDNLIISHLYFDKSKRLWIINNIRDNTSVSCYDLNKKELIVDKYRFDTKSVGFHLFRGFFEQADGNIWITGQQIFARYLQKDKQFERVYNGYEAEHGIDYVTITGLMEDREHNIWVSTANNGIFRFNPSKDFFSNTRYVSHTTNLKGLGAPISFVSARDGSLLVGIKDDGFYRFDKNLEQVPLHMKGIADKNSTVIWNMCASSDSNIIWMTAKQGIYKYDQHKNLATYFEPALLKNEGLRHIAEDHTGNLWIGTQEGGVFKWDHLKGKNKFEDGLSPFSSIPPVAINRIITDRQGYIWVATNGEGAYMTDPATDSVQLHFHSLANADNKLPEASAQSVLDFNDSLVIIAAKTRLLVYNRLQHTTYLLGGSLSGLIASIEKDDNGHLWVSTTTCLYRVTVNNRVFLQMNRNDGMENDSFLPGASYVLPDKRMVFGVFGVMIAFLPSAIKTGPIFPDLQVTGFTAKDKPLQVDSLLRQKTIVLSPQQNSLAIDLSVLSYNSGYLLQYKLEDLDKEWKTVGTNYQLLYSYLPPGTYTLHVKTVDADGVAGQKTIQLSIRINPPFWRTGWFYFLLLLVLVLFLFWLDRQRMTRRDAIQHMRSNIAGNLHREISIALNNINILSEMAKLKADNHPEKSKEFIGQINIKSEQMIIAMDDMLWSIDPANDTMQKTVDRLREFIEALNSSQHAGIEMQVDTNVENLKLDMQLRHEVLLLFKESIHILVHCGGRNINIHIHYEKSNLVYSTAFSPENCNLKQLNSLFYSKEMQKRLKAIHVKLKTDVNKSMMLVVMRLPV